MEKDISKFVDLPYREGLVKKVKASNGRYGYSIGTSDYHKVNGYFPYAHAERVLNKFHKKSMSKAYSYYCKLVPSYQHKFFYQDISVGGQIELDNVRPWRMNDWYEDENGLVRNKRLESKPKPTLVYIKSPDYKEGYLNPITREVISVIDWYNKKDRSNWDKVVLSGKKWSFTSTRDPGYQKIKQEQDQAEKRFEKIRKDELSKKSYSMLTREEERLKKESELDEIKIESHGFNERSFKGKPYHGRKNKK